MNHKILRKLQMTELQILKEIVRICDNNNLTYFLIGGTLLGAVRHKGFIPWDDDLDIAMPRKDYEKFIEISKTELSENYYLHNNSTDDKYWLPFIKIRLNNTEFLEESLQNIPTHKGIFVDIFPLDNARKQKSVFQDIQAYMVKLLSSVIIYKCGINSTPPSIKMKLWLFIFSPIKSSKLSSLQQKIMSIISNEETDFFINLGSNYNYVKQTIPKNVFYPPVMISFESNLFKAPNDYVYILSRIFGDYLKLPADDNRITHNPISIKFEDGEIINFKNKVK